MMLFQFIEDDEAENRAPISAAPAKPMFRCSIAPGRPDRQPAIRRAAPKS